jgi:hypothetical protein
MNTNLRSKSILVLGVILFVIANLSILRLTITQIGTSNFNYLHYVQYFGYFVVPSIIVLLITIFSSKTYRRVDSQNQLSLTTIYMLQLISLITLIGYFVYVAIDCKAFELSVRADYCYSGGFGVLIYGIIVFIPAIIVFLVGSVALKIRSRNI